MRSNWVSDRVWRVVAIARRNQSSAKKKGRGDVGLAIDQRFVMPLGKYTIDKRKDLRLTIPKSPRLPDKFKNKPDSEDEARGEALMMAINLDLVKRIDKDGRSKLLDKESPDFMPLGSVILVEYVYGRERPHLDVVAGHYVSVRGEGPMRTIFVMTKILGTVIKFGFPLYSPSVRRIKVITRGDCDKDAVDAPGFSFDEAKKKIEESRLRRIIQDTSITDGTYDIKT